MTIEQKIERVTTLVKENEDLKARIREIEKELGEMIGGRLVERVQANVKAKAKKPAAGKGDVRHPCCGSKQQRHKNSCPSAAKASKKPAPEPETEEEFDWECLECSKILTRAEAPEECVCGSRTFIQK